MLRQRGQVVRLGRHLDVSPELPPLADEVEPPSQQVPVLVHRNPKATPEACALWLNAFGLRRLA